MIANADGTDNNLALTKPTITLGRAPSCDIVLNDALTADEHAQIVSNEQYSEFIALVDSAKTMVDGKPAPRGQPVRLKPLSRIFIGGSSLIFSRAAEPSLLEQMLQTAEGRLTPPLGTRKQRADLVLPPPADAVPAPTARSAPSAAAPISEDATQALPTRRKSRDTDQQIIVRIKERPKVERVPTGHSITYVVEVTNRSETVDSVYLTVEGIPTAADSPGGSWVTITPERRALHPPLPGEAALSGEFAIQVHPPRNAHSLAKLHRATIVARFQTQQSARASEEIAFVVERFDDFQLEPLEPESQTAWRQANYIFSIENGSNHAQEFSIKGRERERAIEFRCRPAQVIVGPGESQEIQVQGLVTRGQQRFFGDRKEFNFTISVTPERATTPELAAAPEPGTINSLQLNGTLVQQPPLSQWVSLFALLLALFLCVCIGLTAALARFAPNLYQRSIAPVVGIVAPPLVPNTPSATTELPTQAPPPTYPPLPTYTPLPTPELPDIEATFAPLKTQAAQDLIAKKTEIAGQSDDQKTALAAQYVVTSTLMAINQAQTSSAITSGYAQTSTAIAQANASQIALQKTQFSETQIAASLFATQTELARPTITLTPTPSNTPPPTPTQIADVIVNFATTASGQPVVERIQMQDNEFFQQDVSICFFGPPPPTEEPTVSVGIPTAPATATPDYGDTSGGSLVAAESGTSVPVVRCQPPAILRYDGRNMAYAPVIYPPLQYVNSDVPYLTTDEGNGKLRSNVFGVITFQSNMIEVRLRIFNPNSVPVTYYTVAFDERGEVVGISTNQLGVLGPYILNVTASKPIRQVLVLGVEGATAQDEALLRSSHVPAINSPLLITQVEANARRR
jgi:pSer/pThr/pTyr-binding forkhead associated (FHA) protein